MQELQAEEGRLAELEGRWERGQVPRLARGVQSELVTIPELAPLEAEAVEQAAREVPPESVSGQDSSSGGDLHRVPVRAGRGDVVVRYSRGRRAFHVR